MKGYWAFRNAGTYEIFELKKVIKKGTLVTKTYLFYIIRENMLEYNLIGAHINLSKTEAKNYYPINTLSTMVIKNIIKVIFEGKIKKI